MSMLNHVLLEVFCLKNTDANMDAPYPNFCHNQGKYASYSCLLNKCPYLDFTSCENALCYIGPESDMEHGILFGGDMDEGDPSVGLDAWSEIAIAKVDEAYNQFMEKKQRKL